MNLTTFVSGRKTGRLNLSEGRKDPLSAGPSVVATTGLPDGNQPFDSPARRSPRGSFIEETGGKANIILVRQFLSGVSLQMPMIIPSTMKNHLISMGFMFTCYADYIPFSAI